MSRVFITGSSDGIGLLAAKLLIEQGHGVVLHGRNASRSGDAVLAASGAEGVVTGDLSTVAGTKIVADEANKLGPFDAVIHNAGIGYRQTRRTETEPGVPDIFAVNVLAPYILTALIERPRRLIYAPGCTRAFDQRWMIYFGRNERGAAPRPTPSAFDRVFGQRRATASESKTSIACSRW